MSGSTVPKKALGQNFLISDRVGRRILRLANIESKDIVLEIGPGTGFLTRHLLQAAAQVIAIEKDPELVLRLRQRWPELLGGRFQLYPGDILTLSLDAILPPQPVQIVGNLPYNISTSIIRKMKPWRHRFHKATFMLQKEVAERMLAQPGSRDYGYFSVWTALLFERRAGFDVRPGCFRPIPKVHSAVLQLVPRLDSDVTPEFDSFLKRAFRQPRKTLRNNLAGVARYLDEALAAAGIDARTRPHQLSKERFRVLWEGLRPVKWTLPTTSGSSH